MTTEEMITELLSRQLAEHLRIDIQHEPASVYGNVSISVEVYFAGEVVARSSTTIYE